MNRDELLSEKRTYEMMLENTSCPINAIHARGMLITIEEKLKECESEKTKEAK
jgi:hypothetical protein